MLLAHWFRSFATTAHSERLGPELMLEAFVAGGGGDDPGAWNLDALPFRVTAVHNRVDLGDGTHCGELRVSLASIDPVHQPFHLIFLFRQPATDADRAPSSVAHCAATALRWARLSDLDDAAFRVEARALLDEALVRDRFLLAESLEFLVAPWEWRQWFPVDNPDAATRATLPEIFENRPLFQTVDTPALNRPGALRDDFLGWLADNAEAVDARRIEIPDRFRSPSARVNQGVPWIPLDVTDLDADVAARFPRVRQNLEIVGCPACHATDAEFVQTLPDRTFSPFYDTELDARAGQLDALARGTATRPPFGPLQPAPALPP